MNVKKIIMEEFGYHVYKKVWVAAVGEELICERGPHSSHDRYTVAVKRMGIIIGHLPRKLSKLFAILETRWFYVLYQG